jgi:3-deoxy-manno-octulosonate cytidylyltransferase (CMP-KDO synthetase)
MLDGSKRLGVIPARANSSRFPKKILARIHGRPMIQYVWEAAKRARLLDEVIVATDDAEILAEVRSFGGKAVLTPATFSSGTDRVAYAAQESAAEIIVNLQGDEPLLTPEAIDRLIEALEADPGAEMATLAVVKRDPGELRDGNIVKVVPSGDGRALYFSRQPLAASQDGSFFKHVGVYAFRAGALGRFCRLEASALEKAERLEQLRALENGMAIRVVLIAEDTIAVDTPSDIAKVEARLDALAGRTEQ